MRARSPLLRSRTLVAGVALVAFLAALLAPAPAAARDCTCDELRDYLKTVEKKKECYKQAYVAGRSKPFATVEAQTAFLENCMGWVPGSAVSEGKASSAKAEEIKAAQDKCRRDHCEWICRESIDNVHEKYHDWYDFWERDLLVVVAWRSFNGTADSMMIQENAVGEIGAHDAEAAFLRDKIKSAELNGECANVRKTVDPVERDRRIQEAAEHVKKYLEGLGDPP